MREDKQPLKVFNKKPCICRSVLLKSCYCEKIHCYVVKNIRHEDTIEVISELVNNFYKINSGLELKLFERQQTQLQGQTQPLPPSSVMQAKQTQFRSLFTIL
jgi:hypothetical protein